VSDWEPATEAESAMLDALRVGDQEQYFRLLGRTDLILPVAADAGAARGPVGWGTWTADSRTHVLAFTSPSALDACLAEHAGTFRKVAFQDLAADWPDLEWWLAVNPGLPVEAYLPAWFVAQISRGDVRLPGRTLGARARIEQADAMRSRQTRGDAATQEQPRQASAPTLAPPQPTGLTRRGDLLSRGFPARRAEERSDPSTSPGFARPDDERAEAPTSPGFGGTRDGMPTNSPVAAPPPAAPAPPAPPPPPPQPEFEPNNSVEENLLDAAGGGSTDTFLSTLLLAKILVPGPTEDALGHLDQWRTENVEGQPYAVVFTSTELLEKHLGPDAPAAWVKFTQLIHAWPSESLSFAVNPGTPIGATLPGSQIVALASWADEVGLTDEPTVAVESPPEPEPRRSTAPPAAQAGPVVMQKTISAQQVPYYLERGYDRVSGFVHRATEVSHLRTPAELYNALGLNYTDSPFKPDDAEVYVLRWAAHRGNLYRIPYGGQHEAAMHAMQGWVIERSPFRGNGFAPSESRDVIAEFKVDSVRLPHGAELWRVDREGGEKLVAMFDADGPRWQPVGEE
jgi:hypothetical protein